MIKFALLGVAVVATCAVLAGPAFAQHKATHTDIYAEGGWCANREPGNPFTKEEDYMAWSAWRARGGWDDHNDFNCGSGHASHSGF
jgi:hypothetical protein